MADADLRANRPLSPHLQVYRLIPTMLMSIMHRITGAALYFGTILVAWWLISVALGGSYYTVTADLFGSIVGRLVLFGYSWVLFHHMLGGIRHLLWDLSYGISRESSQLLAKATLAGSLALTVLVWAGVLLVG